MSEDTLDSRLRSAVRAGDAETVRALLEEGADPNTVDADADSAPVLCVAVAAYDAVVAEALVEGGADPDRVLPDGTTPLWRAVDGGSPAVFSAVLGKEPRLRMPEEARERLLTLARGWYETGAAEELRRRAGTPGPVDVVRVQDDEYEWVEQVSLGGLVVRAGHGAVLTSLEWAFRILTPVEELIARAVDPPHEDHVNWSTVCVTLTQRRSFETWSAVVAHRHDSDPPHRRFVLDFVRLRSLVYADGPSHEKRESDFLAAWAAEETDSGLLAKVLDLYTEYTHRDQEAIGLRYADHPDPRVRREVPYAFPTYGVPLTPAAKAALLTLTRDPDVGVRVAACEAGMRDDDLLPEITRALLLLAEDPDPAARSAAATTLAGSRIRTPAVSDALVALLAHTDQLVRLEAAYGLAVRDDPRTGEAIDRVGPLGAGFEDDHRAGALRMWRWRKRNPGGV
ncbi:HEAT repeat domain-containing protein [Streptomyces sp. ME02-8801-2C]|uniref:HEAT repeat domain-containing protein n=1 Tax=Streptomyces sp. ME02-8801-2C TaxID=3028680 RepID=UPI0029AEA601|nr:HEAT repeat domain-containing protein [Streptomyces sp. ME02-8801-2C]MDX3458278.1 HEAT repeat domain-containing protein [Streptomyces sp. ME02-8801-2C]